MMNSKLYSHFAFALLVSVAILLGGCGKWDDIHGQFIDSGEIVYTGKADSVKTRGGLNRIELSWLFTSDPKISKYKVYWNNRTDSLSSDFQRSPDVDTVRLMLNDMPEGTYHFEIYTYDDEGHSSVKAETIGKVYGEEYKSSLLSRALRGSTRFGKDRLLNWIPADEALVRSELTYINGDGELKEIRINKKDETNVLENIPLAANFNLRSVFLPDTMALDTFYTDFETIKYGYEWTDWNDYNVVFGNHGSLIMVHANGNLFRSTENTEGGEMNYNLPSQLGNGWTIFETVFTNRNTLIGWYKSISSVFRYNFDHINVAFTDQAQIAATGWDKYNQVFAFQGDIVGRDTVTAKLYRHYTDPAENFTGNVDEIVNGDSWAQYVILTAVQSWVIGKTADGKLWRIPITGNIAGVKHLLADNWQTVVGITIQGNDLLARNSNGELWQYSLDSGGNLGQPVQIKIPSGELRL